MDPVNGRVLLAEQPRNQLLNGLVITQNHLTTFLRHAKKNPRCRNKSRYSVEGVRQVNLPHHLWMHVLYFVNDFSTRHGCEQYILRRTCSYRFAYALQPPPPLWITYPNKKYKSLRYLFLSVLKAVRYRDIETVPKWIFVGKGVYRIDPHQPIRRRGKRNSMGCAVFNFFSQKSLFRCNLSSVVIKRSSYKTWGEVKVSHEYFCHDNNIGFDIDRSYNEFLKTITMLRTGCTLDDYTRDCSALRFDIKLREELRLQPFNNPEVVTSPYYESLIRMQMGAYSARTFFINYFNTPESKLTDYELYDSQLSNGREVPFWTFNRMGKSITKLPDGREIHIGGEYEDYYDPDFCIYNDVICLNTDDSIQHFVYPADVFPPTDFHTATLVGHFIYVIGSVGYKTNYGTTQICRLDTRTFQMERLTATGNENGPGWIGHHTATFVQPEHIVIDGGKVNEIVKYCEGDVVEVKLNGWTKYYNGTIVRGHRDGSYDIQFLSGHECSLNDDNVVFVNLCTSSSENFDVGDKVQCPYRRSHLHGDLQWYNGKYQQDAILQQQYSNGDWQVLFSFGISARVKAVDIIFNTKHYQSINPIKIGVLESEFKEAYVPRIEKEINDSEKNCSLNLRTMERTAGFKGKERPNLAKFMRRSNRLNAAQHGRSIFYNAFVKTTTTQGAEQEMAFEEEYHNNEYVNRNTNKQNRHSSHGSAFRGGKRGKHRQQKISQEHRSRVKGQKGMSKHRKARRGNKFPKTTFKSES